MTLRPISAVKVGWRVFRGGSAASIVFKPEPGVSYETMPMTISGDVRFEIEGGAMSGNVDTNGGRVFYTDPDGGRGDRIEDGPFSIGSPPAAGIPMSFSTDDYGHVVEP